MLPLKPKLPGKTRKFRSEGNTPLLVASVFGAAGVCQPIPRKPIVPNKPEPVSYWDMSKLLKDMATLVEKLPNAILTQIKDAEDAELCDLKGKAENVLNELKGVEAAINAKVEEIVRQADDSYQRIKASKQSLQHRLDELPGFEVKIPFGCKELIDLAERCSHLSDTQWERVIDLAKALAAKPEPVAAE